jgi:hypothetical protein
MSRVTRDDIKIRAVRNYYMVDPTLGKRIAKGVGLDPDQVFKDVKKLEQAANLPSILRLQQEHEVQ